MLRTVFLALGVLPFCGATAGASGEGAAPAPGAAVALPEERIDDSRQESALQRLWRWSDAQVRGIFESILPDTQERRTWRLTLQPHLADVVREDHIRLPMGIIYGLNRRTEAEIEVEPYVSNPLKDGTSSGLANIRGNIKYAWEPAIDREVRAASGFSFVRPIPGSHRDVTEGFNRYSVYLTMARPSPNIPNLEGFFNLSYDLITPSSAAGRIWEDEPQDDFIRTAVGVLYRKERMTYGLSVAWEKTVDGESTDFVTLTPSVLYDVPSKYTFGTRGRWQVGAALEAKRYGSRSQLDLRVRVRWLIDFQKAWREWRNGTSASRAGASSTFPAE